MRSIYTFLWTLFFQETLQPLIDSIGAKEQKSKKNGKKIYQRKIILKIYIRPNYFWQT